MSILNKFQAHFQLSPIGAHFQQSCNLVEDVEDADQESSKTKRGSSAEFATVCLDIAENSSRDHALDGGSVLIANLRRHLSVLGDTELSLGSEVHLTFDSTNL